MNPTVQKKNLELGWIQIRKPGPGPDSPEDWDQTLRTSETEPHEQPNPCFQKNVGSGYKFFNPDIFPYFISDPDLTLKKHRIRVRSSDKISKSNHACCTLFTMYRFKLHFKPLELCLWLFLDNMNPKIEKYECEKINGWMDGWLCEWMNERERQRQRQKQKIKREKEL